MDKKQFYIYNHNNGALLATFGEKGNGPGELPRSFDMSLDKQNRIIYTFGDKKNISFSIDSIIHEKSHYKYRKQTELNSARNARKISYFDNNKFYSIGDRGSRIAILNEFNDILFSYKDMPVISTIDESDSVYRKFFYFYKSVSTLKPDATKLAYATTCGLHLEIFSMNEDTICKEQFHRYIKPKYIKKNPVINDGVIEGCTYLFASNKYIYAIWSDDTQLKPGTKIALFDWKRIPKFMLNIGKPIGYAAVTANDSDLFL